MPRKSLVMLVNLEAGRHAAGLSETAVPLPAAELSKMAVPLPAAEFGKMAVLLPLAFYPIPLPGRVGWPEGEMLGDARMQPPRQTMLAVQRPASSPCPPQQKGKKKAKKRTLTWALPWPSPAAASAAASGNGGGRQACSGGSHKVRLTGMQRHISRVGLTSTQRSAG